MLYLPHCKICFKTETVMPKPDPQCYSVTWNILCSSQDLTVLKSCFVQEGRREKIDSRATRGPFLQYFSWRLGGQKHRVPSILFVLILWEQVRMKRQAIADVRWSYICCFRNLLLLVVQTRDQQNDGKTLFLLYLEKIPQKSRYPTLSQNLFLFILLI